MVFTKASEMVFTKSSEKHPEDEMRRINNIEGEKGERGERERERERC